MAKISDLPAAPAIDGNELLPFVKDGATSAATLRQLALDYVDATVGPYAAEVQVIRAWLPVPGTSITPGHYYDKNTGNLIAQASWDALSPIAVSPGDKIRVSARVNGVATALVVWMGAGDAGYVGQYLPFAGAPVSYMDHEVIVPEGAFFARICSNTDIGVGYSPSAKIFRVDPSLSDAPQQISGLAEETARHEADIANLRGFFPAPGTNLITGSVYDKNTGLTAAYTQWTRLSPVPVRPGDQIQVTATVNGGVTALVVWMGENGVTYVGNTLPYVSGAPIEYVDQLVTVPQGAFFALVCSYHVTGTLPGLRTRRTDPRLPTVPDRVETAEAVIETLESEMDGLRNWHDHPDSQIIAGSYYNYNNGTVSAQNQWTRLAPLACVPGQKLRVTATVNGAASALVVWMNASGTGYVGHTDRFSGSAPIEYTDHEITVPAGTYRALVCSHVNASGKLPQVKLFGVNPALAQGTPFDPVTAASLTRIRRTVDRGNSKKILWLGTSIPAGSLSNASIGGYTGPNRYPSMVAWMLGANVVNQALGSSAARAGVFAYKNAAGGDPLGWTSLGWDGLWRSLSHTLAEKNELIANWETKWRDLLSGAGKPVSLDAATQANWRASSYETKLIPNLDADVFVFDHGHNDAAFAPGGTSGNELMDRVNADIATRDRTTFHGAINYLIDLILASNPRAQIVFCGHYENGRKAQVSQAQAALAEFWDFPLIETWKRAGFSRQIITGTGTHAGKTMTQMWMPDDLHPHSDNTGAANWRLANIIAAALRDILGLRRLPTLCFDSRQPLSKS